MSSWTTVTFTIDFEDEIELSKEKLQQIVLGYIRSEGGKASSYITNGMDVFVKPKGIKIGEMLKDLADYYSRAVVIDANDTGETGEAELYEIQGKYDRRPWKRDQYVETQKHDGCHTGRKAAAYMMFAHDIDAQAAYSNHWSLSEEEVGYDETGD